MWSDLSPAVKAVIVIGGILAVGLLVFWFGPFGGHGEQVQPQRGLQAPAAE